MNRTSGNYRELILLSLDYKRQITHHQNSDMKVLSLALVCLVLCMVEYSSSMLSQTGLISSMRGMPYSYWMHLKSGKAEKVRNKFVSQVKENCQAQLKLAFPA